MEPLLSIVYVARDDEYGDDYNCVNFGTNDVRNTDPNFYKTFEIKYNNVQRIKFTLNYNLDLLEKYFNNKFEIIFIDWSPIKSNYLINNPELNNVLNHKCIKNVIVDENVVQHKGLNPQKFYEFYGKNVGIRVSTGKFVLISNPDDVITEQLMRSIHNTISTTDVHNKYYRCYSRLDVDHNLKTIAEGLSFPNNGNLFDSVMGTPASGDFLLTTRCNYINLTGYHEIKSNGNQAMLDGKLVIKMYTSDIKPIVLSGSIMHLDHKKHDRSGGDYLNWKNDYNNEQDEWGFNKYKLNFICDNVFKISI